MFIYQNKQLFKLKMATFFFIIVLLHLALGFGWMIYKMEFQKRKKNKKEPE